MIRVDANDHDFHLALIANCGSSWLVQFCEVLMDHAQRCVFISASAAYPRRSGQDEHKRIADAALNGHVGEAKQLLVAHYMRTLEYIESERAS
ncbi:MAG TPA: FCD domain-containing protein [Shinella sp.]|jgi:DNA-binding GntR family transcriptional regulator|uniref:FCD domain-containing protein n=1 Tax=Shinella sp. TaxID=1870904 RepID=UPI002E160EAC|nr:FCD domain-containing protein [Shinella sp.]